VENQQAEVSKANGEIKVESAQIERENEGKDET